MKPQPPPGVISLVFCLLVAVAGMAAADAAPAAKPGHVFVIVLENEGFDITFGPKSPATYLNGLAKQGALLTQYYGIGHFSLDNYIAMVSGQGVNPVTQSDCQSFTEFAQTGMAPDGQAVGAGCVYPASVKTIADQLVAKGLSWKAYMEDMGDIPSREAALCGRPALGAPDQTQRAVQGDQYAARHNPFVYFHSIIDTPACDADVVALTALAADLKSVATTPNYVFITPNLCHDGHDGGEDGRKCVNGEPGGLVSADKFLADTVPQILSSPAFRQDGLLIVTFDEADIDLKYDPATKSMKLEGGDSSACCGEEAGPNLKPGDKVFGGLDDQGPGVSGPGGGRIGAVLVSPFIAPGAVSDMPYNHYSLLRSVEDLFGLDHLGYAGQAGLKPFGADIFRGAK
jgi:hypothetical protein